MAERERQRLRTLVRFELGRHPRFADDHAGAGGPVLIGEADDADLGVGLISQHPDLVGLAADGGLAVFPVAYARPL
jgi:hypothetical protein